MQVDICDVAEFASVVYGEFSPFETHQGSLSKSRQGPNVFDITHILRRAAVSEVQRHHTWPHESLYRYGRCEIGC
jgi:hypothetical protein